MRILIATLLYTSTVVAEENIQEIIKTLDSFYPEKNTYIKYQQEWQMNLYKERIIDFKNDPIGQARKIFEICNFESWEESFILHLGNFDTN